MNWCAQLIKNLTSHNTYFLFRYQTFHTQVSLIWTLIWIWCFQQPSTLACSCVWYNNQSKEVSKHHKKSNKIQVLGYFLAWNTKEEIHPRFFSSAQQLYPWLFQNCWIILMNYSENHSWILDAYEDVRFVVVLIVDHNLSKAQNATEKDVSELKNIAFCLVLCVMRGWH